jgi:hypothetical protein
LRLSLRLRRRLHDLGDLAAFPPNRRGAAIGAWSAIIGTAVAIGPLVGGAIVAEEEDAGERVGAGVKSASPCPR